VPDAVPDVARHTISSFDMERPAHDMLAKRPHIMVATTLTTDPERTRQTEALP